MHVEILLVAIHYDNLWNITPHVFQQVEGSGILSAILSSCMNYLGHRYGLLLPSRRLTYGNLVQHTRDVYRTSPVCQRGADLSDQLVAYRLNSNYH